MEKEDLAALKAAIIDVQYADDLLDWGAASTSIVITLRGDQDRVLQIQAADEDFETVLGVIQKIASARKQARLAEIDTIIAPQ